MSLPDSIIFELSRGVARQFADWPDRTVPVFGAGVYTIWDNDGRFIYVGMSGRGITAETVRRNSPLGIYTACIATPVDAAAETSSVFMSRTGLSCRRYPKKT